MQRHRRGLEEKLEMIVIKENEEMKSVQGRFSFFDYYSFLCRNRKATVAFVVNEKAHKTGSIRRYLPSRLLFLKL